MTPDITVVNGINTSRQEAMLLVMRLKKMKEKGSNLVLTASCFKGGFNLKVQQLIADADTVYCYWLRGLSNGRNSGPLILAIPRWFYQVGVPGQAFFVEGQEAVGLFLGDGAFLYAVDQESRHPSSQFVSAELDK